MKTAYGWQWPDHEVHLIEWMSKTPAYMLNGRRAYQGQKQALVLQHCRKFRIALDVGAHIGLWSFNLAERFEHVHAFEPVEAHRECFAANVKAENVTMHGCALGAAKATCDMAVADGSSGDTRVAPGLSVEMLPLDHFSFKFVDLIKVDCEGYEENVLRGAEETIKTWRPTIIVEQKRDMATRFDLKPLGGVEYLKSIGYKQVLDYGGDFVMVAK